MSRGIGERGVFDCGPGNALPRRRILPEKRRHGNRGHQEEGAASRRVANARPTPPSQRVDTGEKNGDQGALPEKGGEGPAQTPEERVCQKGSEVSHRMPLSSSSRISRIFARSWGEVFLVERARMTRAEAEPANARSSRSPTSCNSVSSRGARAR